MVIGGTKYFEGFPADSSIVPVFTFTLSEDGTVIDTKTVHKHGPNDFDSITYTEPGEHTYTIREVAGGQAGVIYDDTVYTVTVTVTDDGSGQLSAAITGDSVTGRDLDFVNTFEATMEEENVADESEQPAPDEEPEQPAPTEEPEQDDLTEETAVEELAAEEDTAAVLEETVVEESAVEEDTATVLTETGEVPIVTSPDDEPTGEYYIDDMGVPRALYVNKDGEEYYLDDNDVPRAAWRLPKTGYGPNLDWLLIAAGGLSLSVMLAALYKKNHGK